MAFAFPVDFKIAETFFTEADYRLLLIGIDFKIHPLLDRAFDPIDCLQFLLDEPSVADRIADHALADGLNLTKEFAKISAASGLLDVNAAKALWAVLCYGQDLVHDPVLNPGWWTHDYITNGPASNR
jgi:hypothetical protein